MEKLFDIQALILKQFSNQPFYERLIFKQISLDNQLTGIVGTRGIGKTTYLLQTALQHGAKELKALYISADNVYFLETKLIDLVDRLYKETNVRLLCIDEIQKYSQWNQELKNIYDTYMDFKIVFSGSSMIDLINSKYDLSRRVTLHHLHGFSLREYCAFYAGIELPHFSLPEIIEKHTQICQEISIPNILMYFNQYLQCGYYPFFKRFQQEQDKYQAIENTSLKAIYEDIATLHRVQSTTLATIEKIYKYVLHSLPGELNAYKLANILAKDFESVSTYLRYLQEAGLIRSIYPKKSGKALLRNPIKMFPDNTNLIYASNLPHLQDNLRGKLRETFAVNQLQNAGYAMLYSPIGDFMVDDFCLEIGGKNKTVGQIKEATQGFVFADGILSGLHRKIPLYLLGLLY
jgi:uncharacterized protein